MPTFNLYRETSGVEECWWVYAVDEWDARDQIERTLGFNAHCRISYQCNEDVGMRAPLNVIIDSNGRNTSVKGPDIDG
jgi:hypothetical protein